MTMTDNILYYDDQLKFKAYARKNLGLNKNLYYFDSTSCVDAKTSRDIRNVQCDGTLTWGEAAARIKKHFKIA